MRAEFDGDAVTLLKRAGAIPVGVTITPELCFWWESYNTLYGRCCNPYDTTRTAGGSSGKFFIVIYYTILYKKVFLY